MPMIDNAWYVNYGNGSSTGYYATAQWTALTAYAAGDRVRQLATPAVNSERIFICIIAGTTLAAEPTWGITRGAKTAEAAGPTWQECTGIAGLNGSEEETPTWTVTATPPGGVKNTAVVLGQVIKRDNAASYQICTTAGTAGNGAEPAFSDTAGVTTADNTVTWTSLGVVGNFADWSTPHARLKNAHTSTWGASGNTFWLASEHAETQSASHSLLLAGGASNPTYNYCVTKTTVPPTSANLTTGASIATTGANALDIYGYAYCSGLVFSVGSGAVNSKLTLCNSNVGRMRLFNCALRKLGTTGVSGAITLGDYGLGNYVCELVNCTVEFGSTNDSISAYNCKWYDTADAISGSTFPTVLISGITGSGPVCYLENIDLSALGSGKTIFGAINTGRKYAKNCKFDSSVTKSATPNYSDGEVNIINSDSAATNYINEKYGYYGSHVPETTIVRTGGATDGTTPVAWKIVTTANSKWLFPFECMPLAAWNDTVGSSVTLTVYGVWGGGAVPLNDEIWIDVNYMGSTATPIGTKTTTTKADNLATGANTTTDTSTWGGSTTKFKMSVTFTPQMEGFIYVTVKAAKVSSTFYIDPKPVLS